jgi:hypothetical protein
MKSILVKWIAVFVIAMWSLAANAIIINLNATISNGGPNDLIINPVTINLNPTDLFTINLIGIADGGMYDAWNPWGVVSGCTNGANCTIGWVNTWVLDANPFGGFGFGDGIAYATPALALANGSGLGGPFSASLTGITSLSFGFLDDPYTDNLGGISLEVLIESTVPVPATLALFGLGLAGLGWSRRKKA